MQYYSFFTFSCSSLGCFECHWINLESVIDNKYLEFGDNVEKGKNNCNNQVLGNQYFEEIIFSPKKTGF